MSRRRRGGSAVSPTMSAGDELVMKVLVLDRDQPGVGAGSKQLPPSVFEAADTLGLVVRPPYDPNVWAGLPELNTRLMRCLTAMARNTVGLGWEIVAKQDSKDFMKKNKKQIEEEKVRLTAMLSEPNDEDEFSELCFKSKLDEETVGDGYVEFVPDVNDNIVEINHAPAHTIRVLKDGSGYVQVRNDATASYITRKGKDGRPAEMGRVNGKDFWRSVPDHVFFKKFGDERIMDCNTGEFVTNEDYPMELRATELLQFSIYSPRTSFYGIPRYVSTAPAISGSRLAHIANVSLFENDAVPRMAILVQGGSLSAKSIETIEDFVRFKGKGPENRGRVMILEAQAKTPAGEGKTGVTLMPLTVGVQDDASWTRYQERNDNEVKEAFGISDIFLGTSKDVNRAVAFTMKQLTLEQVFEPESRRWEYRWNKKVMTRLGAKYTKLRFLRPKAINLLEESAAWKNLSSVAGMTPNDVREELGKEPYQGGWANTPLEVLKLGLFEPTDGKQTNSAEEALGVVPGGKGATGGSAGGGGEPTGGTPAGRGGPGRAAGRTGELEVAQSMREAAEKMTEGLKTLALEIGRIEKREVKVGRPQIAKVKPALPGKVR